MSWGHRQTIYVFADDNIWKYAEKSLRETLERFQFTTENEPYFELKRATNIEQFYKFNNLLFLGDMQSDGEISTYIRDMIGNQIETELNEIGYQLATYDALVDYSTINLVMVKTEDVIILLDRTEKPYLQVVDYDSDSISVKVFNTSENSVTMYLDVKDNGVVVETFEQDAYGISYLEFELTDLDPATSYTFEIYDLEDDHSVSLSNLSK